MIMLHFLAKKLLVLHDFYKNATRKLDKNKTTAAIKTAAIKYDFTHSHERRFDKSALPIHLE